MEAKTCEQYVLAELEAAQLENDALRAQIEELKAEAARRDANQGESPDGEIEPRQVQVFKINEPFETAYLSVQSSYRMRDKEHGLGLTSDEAREKASTEEGLLEVAEKRVGWSLERCMRVETRLWPCQLRTGTQTFVFDVYDSGRELMETRVCKDEESVATGRYFPAYRADELRSYGLELLRKNLLEYADKLDAEAAKDEEEK